MLSPGTKLGTYEITSHIGSGGMGDVYRAHDSKLSRDVAIKVLPEQFARDPERLARFQREAKMLAALNHPNIAAIYGLEQSGDAHYLVMELVPGETLREKVAGGRPLPVEEALTIAKQIAEALEAAHNSEKVIIHRDLKPANVKVTPEGRVKVLDFGLAKAFTNETASEDIANSPTLSALPTQQGAIMGTAGYMSPEQACGKPVTKATDIWALGCVLYELLTGRQAFHGKDAAEILAAVTMKEPAFDALPASTPPAIRTLLRRCLRKDQRQRLQDATGVRIEIEEALAAPPSSQQQVIAAPQRTDWRWALLLGLACLAIGAIFAGITVWYAKRTPPSELQPVARMAIVRPGERLLGAERGGPVVVLSPDGSRLVSVVRRGGSTQLYVRRLDQLEFTPISGTEGAASPFFSPDGQWIGFYSTPDTKLKKVSTAGGAPQTVCDTATINGASWGSDDSIIFSGGTDGSSGLQQVAAAGGTPRVLTTPDSKKGETGHSWPDFLPDGKSILFAVEHSGKGPGDADIVVQSLETGARQALITGGTQPRYVPTGHVIYVQGGVLMAAPFDLARRELTGTPVPIQDGLLHENNAAFTFSNRGWLVYESSGDADSQLRRLVWVDRKGVAQPLAAPPRRYQFPRLSPDGRSIAVEVPAAKSDIWLYDLTRETLSRLTSEGDNTWPIWTPDSKRVTFTSNNGGHLNLFWKLADGSDTGARLTTSEHLQTARSWSPDGQELVFSDTDPSTDEDIWVLPLQGDRKPRPFLRTPFSEGWAQISSDARWLAYVSKELARSEVYVQPFPNGGGRWQISTDGGTEPVWAHGGRELFYRSGDKMMVVDIVTQPTFSAGKPRLLFESAEYVRVSTTPNYDVSADGRRFLMIQADQQQSAGQFNVVLNWFEELKRRVPAGK